MNASEIDAVVLAVSDGRSTWGTKRFTASICGMPAIARVHRALRSAGISRIVLLTDAASELAGIAPWSDVLRADPPATSRKALPAERPVVVVVGDLPLLTAETIRSFALAFLAGRTSRSVEVSGLLAAFRSGAVAADVLALAARDFDNPAGPFGRGDWRPANAEDTHRLASANDYAAVSAVARQRAAEALGDAGVLLVDPACTYVDEGVTVGAGTVLYPGTHIRGESSIGANCVIGPDSWIESSTIEDGAVVRYSVLEEARVRERATIGPFAHLRRGSDIGSDARVGNFVEVKGSRLGRGVKAGHLSYLGDAEVGEGANIGAGTITCNFDGAAKHRTVIEDDAFVGSNTSLIAPVTIGRGAVIGAGSTITEDVPPGMLALARARQVNKERKGATPKEGE